MEWMLLALAGGSGGAYAVQRLRALRADRRREIAELEVARRLAEEDVAVLGEQLRRLGTEVAGRALDDAACRDYQEALDDYEAAARRALRLRSSDDVSALSDTLAEGRYALACVRARAAGQDVPEHRVPCFFNPQHGPSTRDVEWTPPRHGTRTVPACGQCAARVVARQPLVLRSVPACEADSAYLRHTRGHLALGTAAAAAGLAWSMEPDPDISRPTRTS